MGLLKGFLPSSPVGRMAFGVCLSSVLNVVTKISDNWLKEEGLFWLVVWGQSPSWWERCGVDSGFSCDSRSLRQLVTVHLQPGSRELSMPQLAAPFHSVWRRALDGTTRVWDWSPHFSQASLCGNTVPDNPQGYLHGDSKPRWQWRWTITAVLTDCVQLGDDVTLGLCGLPHKTKLREKPHPNWRAFYKLPHQLSILPRLSKMRKVWESVTAKKKKKMPKDRWQLTAVW